MKIIGIDAGSSNIKIVAMDEKGNITNKLILAKCKIEKAFEKFKQINNIKKEEISKIVITGVGQAGVIENLQGYPTSKVDEFTAIGKGATYLAGMEEALIISIGTGTAFVRANNGNYQHIGGTRSRRRNTYQFV